jgi:adenylyltransferase/sulfurtransferase
MSEAVCPNCHEPGHPEILSAIEEGSPQASLPLAKVGIPPYDILRVDGPEGSGFFLLAGDRSASFGRGT